MTKPSEILMPQRPQNDRPLDARIALAALREQFPEQTFHRAEPLGSGWGADVYLVDDHLVARFPRNAELAEWLDHDETLLRFVGSSLGSVLRVPEVRFRGGAGAHLPHGFLVCAFVPGIGADDAAAPVNEGLAQELGDALTHIHSVSVEAATAAGLERQPWDDSDGPPRFLHGDFSRGNLLVDPGSGRLSGVIDWGNAAIGDPALDFAPLVLWRGWPFARAVIAAYRLPMEHDFMERVRRHAQIEALQWLTDAIKRRADPEPHLSRLKIAFDL